LLRDVSDVVLAGRVTDAMCAVRDGSLRMRGPVAARCSEQRGGDDEAAPGTH